MQQRTGSLNIKRLLVIKANHVSSGRCRSLGSLKSFLSQVSQLRGASFLRFSILSFLCSCCCSVTQSCPTLCNPVDCSTPGFPVLHYILELIQTHVHPVGDAIQPSLSLLPPFPPALNLSQHQGLFSELVLCIRWSKDWSFSFSISPSNEYSELISFRMDWFDSLAVQGTLKSLLQHHSSKASILLHSAFSMVQLSHPYMTTGKTSAFTMLTQGSGCSLMAARWQVFFFLNVLRAHWFTSEGWNPR